MRRDDDPSVDGTGGVGQDSSAFSEGLDPVEIVARTISRRRPTGIDRIMGWQKAVGAKIGTADGTGFCGFPGNGNRNRRLDSDVPGLRARSS
jgi:hypothetical protein